MNVKDGESKVDQFQSQINLNWRLLDKRGSPFRLEIDGIYILKLVFH